VYLCNLCICVTEKAFSMLVACHDNNNISSHYLMKFEMKTTTELTLRPLRDRNAQLSPFEALE